MRPFVFALAASVLAVAALTLAGPAARAGDCSKALHDGGAKAFFECLAAEEQ